MLTAVPLKWQNYLPALLKVRRVEGTNYFFSFLGWLKGQADIDRNYHLHYYYY